MIRTTARLLFALPIVALAACDTTGPNIRAQLYAQLESQEESWAENGAASYSVRISRECQCTNLYDVHLQVEDDVVISGFHDFDNAPLTALELEAQLTLPELFDLVRDALDRKVPDIAVNYNQEFGFVQQLYINYDFGRTDDDVIFTVTEYEATTASTT